MGLHGSQSTALVIEVLRAAIAGYGVPGEILTDNGTQYVTWRGKSQFTRELEKLGIRQIVARPKRPQTLGKIERFWGTLWRECVESAVFLDLEDARRRIGLFIDHYNFQRVHSGIEGLVPADRFFHAAPEVLVDAEAACGGERLGAGAAWRAEEAVLPHGPSGRSTLQCASGGGPRDPAAGGHRSVRRSNSSHRWGSESEGLPPPVCPQGVPVQYGALPEELPPGVSATGS